MAETVPLADFAGLIPGSALAALPGGSLRALALRGGRGVNLCLRIDDISGPRCVLRLRRGPELAGADAARELASHRLSAEAGLAPAVLAANMQQGWMIMDHVAADPWTPERLRDDRSLRRLGDQLRLLHTVRVPGFAPVDALALLRNHCDVLHGAQQPDGERLLQRGRELTAQLERLTQRPPVLCHGDPDVGNFLGGTPLLIDFEYAQVADATYDAALLLSYYPFLEARTDAVLEAMGLDDSLSRSRLPLQLALCRLVNSAWARAQTVLAALD